MKKTADEIVRFIDQHYAMMIRSPEQFAESPIGLETQVALLEHVRAFILDCPEERVKFDRFVEALGYGTTGITYESGDSRMLTEERLKNFAIVADVLRQFLDSEGRLSSASEEDAH